MVEEFNPTSFTILVVDDVPNNIKLISTTLATEGYHVNFAVSGKDALHQVNTHHYDLVLMDIMMPEMDGLETCARILALETISHLPIIFLTAKVDENTLVEAFNVGGVDYITKPFVKDELLVRVRTHLLIKKQRDVLEEQKLQIDKQKKDLEALNHNKDKFFSIIAHDLKNPISTLQFLNQLLSDQLANYDSSMHGELHKFSNLLDSTANKLQGLVENLLQWARLQMKRVVFKPVPLDLCQIVEDICNEMSLEIDMKNIQFEKRLPQRCFFTGDQNMLLLVMRNLVSNSMKFTPQNGSIIITIIEESDSIQILVADTGVGMSEEEIKRLIDPESRLSKRGLKGEEGTGLGFMLSREFIYQHGGTVAIESKINEGTTVRITLPKK